MTASKRKGKVARVEDWDRARYSILPARAIVDGRLAFVHVRLLMLIGRVNSQDGWCQLSQTDAADMFGMSRQTVNVGVKELREWGYLEVEGQEATRSSHCNYRVKMDPVEPEDEEGGVSPGDDTPPEGECRLGTTPVSPGDDTRVAYKDTPLDQRSKITPPIPRKAGEQNFDDVDHQEDPQPLAKRETNPDGDDDVGDELPTPARADANGLGEKAGGRNAALIARLRTDPAFATNRSQTIVEHWLVPVLVAKRFSAEDAFGELRKLRDAAKDLPASALDRAAKIALAGTPDTLKPPRLWQALDLARKAHEIAETDAKPCDGPSRAMRDAIKARVAPEIYEAWFAGMTAEIPPEGREIVVRIESRFKAQFAAQQYTQHLDAAAAAVSPGARARIVPGSAP